MLTIDELQIDAQATGHYIREEHPREDGELGEGPYAVFSTAINGPVHAGDDLRGTPYVLDFDEVKTLVVDLTD